VILCMGDDHAWDETGYNGHPHLHTPVLDEMAASGLRLDRFYAAAPVCSPTRGSVLTGRHPNRYGTFAPNWSIRPQEISIADVLTDAGYRCGHFGKWHVGPVKADSPTSPGALGFGQWLSHDNFFEIDPVLSRNGGPPEKLEGESSAVLVEETIRFIDAAREEGKPFLAVVWFGSPHEPYSGLAKDLARYRDVADLYPGRTVRLTGNETGRPVRRPLGEVLQERYAEITAMDRAMGRLRSHLESEGLRDDTLIWYCGDNGIPRSGRAEITLRGQKGQLYEGGVRVPGIIEWPARIPAGRMTPMNAVTSDILPTLCDLAGRPLPERPIDGVSLEPLIHGEVSARSEPICFWNYDTRAELQKGLEPTLDPALQEGTTPLVKQMNGKFTRDFRNRRHPEIQPSDYAGPTAILGRRYKLVTHDRREGEPKRELFDLRDDPAETENVIDQHPEVAEELSGQLRQWQTSVLESLTGADY